VLIPRFINNFLCSLFYVVQVQVHKYKYSISTRMCYDVLSQLTRPPYLSQPSNKQHLFKPIFEFQLTIDFVDVAHAEVKSSTMHAYHPEATRNPRDQSSPLVRMSGMDARVEKLSVAQQYVPSVVNSKQLDPWTMYELAKETQKIKCSSLKSSSTTNAGTPTSHLKKSTSNASTPADSSSSRRKSRQARDPGTTSRKQSRRQQSVVLPLAGSKNEAVTRLIASAKSKRRSLLSEVTDKLNQRQCRSLEDSIASLSHGRLLGNTQDVVADNGEDDDDNGLFGFLDQDEEDFHTSCFF
jgi:hypothetical protein